MSEIARSQLPIPGRRHVGLTTYDAKDPDTPYPPIAALRPPVEAPNVVVIMVDDAGFGASGVFGGPCSTPIFSVWPTVVCGSTGFTPRRCVRRPVRRC